MSRLEKSVETLASVVTSLREQQRQENDVVETAAGNGPMSYAAAVSGERAAGSHLKRKRGGGASADSPRQETPKRPTPSTPPSALFQEAL